MLLSKKKKFVVIGSGPAGWTLFDELSKDQNVTVVLIEKGSDRTQLMDIEQSDPLKWPRVAFSIGEASRYVSEPQFALYSRFLLYPQGNGIGGSCNINAMIFSATHRTIFDRYWPPEWNSNTIDGLLADSVKAFPVSFIVATRSMKNILSPYTSKTQRSTWDKARQTEYCCAIMNHERVHFDKASSLKKPNVKIITNTEAVSVEFDGDRAIGVVVRDLRDGREWTEHSENGGEIVLCCGTFESPRLLFASGFVTALANATASLGSPRKERVLARLGMSLFDHMTLPVVRIGNWFGSAAFFSDSAWTPLLLCLASSVGSAPWHE